MHKDNYLSTYKELIVWQKAVTLVVTVYALTNEFPISEKFVLVDQMKRCSISIASNIAEGRRRGRRKDYRHFLIIAFGSGAELETQLEISKRLGYANEVGIGEAGALLEEIMKMLNVMIARLR